RMPENAADENRRRAGTTSRRNYAVRLTVELPGRGCECRISLAKSERTPPTDEDGWLPELPPSDPEFACDVGRTSCALRWVTMLTRMAKFLAKFFRPTAPR